MNPQSATAQQIRQIDLVSYLGKLGYRPTKIRNHQYWYLSPIRIERNASFVVHRKKNLWYDHGIGEGGDLIDFGMRYHQTSFRELLVMLSVEVPEVNLVPVNAGALPDNKEIQQSPIHVIEERSLVNPTLTAYLSARRIPLAIGRLFCKEIEFELYGKKQVAIGFRNNAGGYELRSKTIKISTSPKDVTFLKKGGEFLLVFEGFFDFLSYWAHLEVAQGSSSPKVDPNASFLILNTLAFFERSRSLMDSYAKVHLYLDRDPAGTARVRQALSWSTRYEDASDLYRLNKDFNEFLIAR